MSSGPGTLHDVSSAFGASLQNLSICNRDNESAMLFSFPGRYWAKNMKFCSAVIIVNFRTNGIIWIDLEQPFFKIATVASLSRGFKVFYNRRYFLNFRRFAPGSSWNLACCGPKNVLQRLQNIKCFWKKNPINFRVQISPRVKTMHDAWLVWFFLLYCQ